MTSAACLATPGAEAATDACYSTAQLHEIAEGLRELEVCQRTLKLRETFIEEQKLALPPPEAAWWQEPTAIMAGVVVSLSVGLVLGAFVLGR